MLSPYTVTGTNVCFDIYVKKSLGEKEAASADILTHEFKTASMFCVFTLLFDAAVGALAYWRLLVTAVGNRIDVS